jgi:hypothetical protein
VPPCELTVRHFSHRAQWEAWLIFTPGTTLDFTTRLVDGPEAAAAGGDAMDVDGLPALPTATASEAASGKAAGFKRVQTLG